MPLTRNRLNNNINKVKKYITHNYRQKNQSAIFKAVRKTIRGKYYFKWKKSITLLNNVNFINENISHWAETDGFKIWLSSHKNWNNHNLYYTLLHEALHGLVIRTNTNHELSEFIEHKFMLNLDYYLIH